MLAANAKIMVPQRKQTPYGETIYKGCDFKDAAELLEGDHIWLYTESGDLVRGRVVKVEQVEGAQVSGAQFMDRASGRSARLQCCGSLQVERADKQANGFPFFTAIATLEHGDQIRTDDHALAFEGLDGTRDGTAVRLYVTPGNVILADGIRVKVESG